VLSAASFDRGVRAKLQHNGGAVDREREDDNASVCVFFASVFVVLKIGLFFGVIGCCVVVERSCQCMASALHQRDALEFCQTLGASFDLDHWHSIQRQFQSNSLSWCLFEIVDSSNCAVSIVFFICFVFV
jgi:hypothetical protein